ncbi:hypothetical protein L6452_17008 [Arctium lappa]|uniref:Uncharacterized protein n=1 Tax=Arctium lappa TaxID=4217 RepID=A0ACB9C240_ARCLA|nr:hypothetical protein L6452_17008 [Arctium lappa]
MWVKSVEIYVVIIYICFHISLFHTLSPFSISLKLHLVPPELDRQICSNSDRIFVRFLLSYLTISLSSCSTFKAIDRRFTAFGLSGQTIFCPSFHQILSIAFSSWAKSRFSDLNQVKFFHSLILL